MGFLIFPKPTTDNRFYKEKSMDQNLDLYKTQDLQINLSRFLRMRGYDC